MTSRREAAERWFIYRGVPHVIHDYRATTGVFTRAVPFLALVFLVEIFASFGDRFDGWAQFGVFWAGAGIALGAVAGVNRLRGRRLFQLPDRVGAIELAVFVLVPPVLPALFSEDRLSDTAGLALINVALLIGTYVVVSFGLLPMLFWAGGYSLSQIALIGRLVGRILPLLLVFSAFLFLNAEVWQVAHDFTWPFYAIVLGVFGLIAFGSVAVRVPSELVGLARFDNWEQVGQLVDGCDSPLAPATPPTDLPISAIPPLDRMDRVNLGLLMFVAQAVRVLLVGVVIGAFYVGFGLLTVREATIVSWVASDGLDPLARFGLFGNELVLTWELLAVSGFIATLSALQFAVSTIVDKAYREHFYDDMANEAREVLATRALYLAELSREAEQEDG
ncbi:hypothetical protein [Candidatus Poriferisocius sp.]|uniref:hypothetical protein n=1 Tax=Candidatus Poriferisocius sp. TaxID=3101276 RepID=UPI003B01482E